MGYDKDQFYAPGVVAIPQVVGWAKIKSYIEVTKPATVGLLVFTAVAGMVAAAQLAPGANASWKNLMKAFFAVTLACAGSNAISCFVDRDLDAIMERTRKRPIPSARIYPPAKALYFGLALVGLGLALAASINWLSVLALVGGIVDYVLVYSVWSKRRTALNIVLGGFSGGFPVLFGWVAVAGKIDLLPILLGALVVLWIPNHIWSIALYCRNDYLRAQVPMLPAVRSTLSVIRCIMATSLILAVFAALIYWAADLGWIYATLGGIATALTLLGALALYLDPTPEKAWKVFKLSSPNLFLIFLGVILDALF